MSGNNQAVVTNFFELFGNQHNVDGVEHLFSTDVVVHQDAVPVPLDLDGYKQLGQVFLQGFPDLKVEIQEQLAVGDAVVTRVLWSGTHTGTFQGIPPTGRSFSNTSIVLDHLANGKIKERWSVSDQLGMMMQLGLIPSPGQ